MTKLSRIELKRPENTFEAADWSQQVICDLSHQISFWMTIHMADVIQMGFRWSKAANKKAGRV